MGTVEQKIIEVLKSHLPEVEVRFDHEPDERISGFIISEKFLDMDHEARQRLVWGLLRAHLTQEERQQVLGFLVYTPEEVKFYTEAYEESD